MPKRIKIRRKVWRDNHGNLMEARLAPMAVTVMNVTHGQELYRRFDDKAQAQGFFDELPGEESVIRG